MYIYIEELNSHEGGRHPHRGTHGHTHINIYYKIKYICSTSLAIPAQTSPRRLYCLLVGDTAGAKHRKFSFRIPTSCAVTVWSHYTPNYGSSYHLQVYMYYPRLFAIAAASANECCHLYNCPRTVYSLSLQLFTAQLLLPVKNTPGTYSSHRSKCF